MDDHEKCYKIDKGQSPLKNKTRRAVIGHLKNVTRVNEKKHEVRPMRDKTKGAWDFCDEKKAVDEINGTE